jgi:hypothetical protein
MELLVLWSVGFMVAAVVASFVWTQDAASPLGDGMILGCLLLAVPLWPVTMPLWLWYVLARHRDEERTRRR